MEEKKLTGYPSIDKPWLKYFSEKWSGEELPHRTVYRSIYENNKDHLDDTAIIFQGFKTSYRKMFAMTEEIAKSLKAIGIGEGDCVNMCITYVPEAICLLLACSKIGALANFMNPLFNTEQKVARFEDTEAKVLVVLDAMFDYMKEALPQIHTDHIVILPSISSLPFVIQKAAALKMKKNTALLDFQKSDARYMSWKTFLRKGTSYGKETEIPYEEGRPVVMVYSSGTTGASKGIVLMNDGINATISNYDTVDFPHERQDTFLTMVPIWFSTGNVLSMLMPLYFGIITILEPVFSKENFAKDMLKYKPNMTLVATSLWRHLLTCPEYKQADLSFIKYPATGGEKVTPEIEENINKFLEERGCRFALMNGYGMCELGGGVATNTGIHKKPATVGYPIKGAIVAAFDMETNQEKQYLERGEIRALTPAHMKGYYKNPEATKEFFYEDAEGRKWGCTGDIGYVDEEGDVVILGRASDGFTVESGEWVYAFDVENVILRESSIAACKVVQSNLNGRNVMVAHMVLREEAKTSATEIVGRIADSCRTNLPEYSIPQYYKLHKALPVHSNGKQDNEALRKDVNELVKM